MYPVVREDAAQMAALQMQAEHGPALAEDPEAFEASLEKVLTKQACATAGISRRLATSGEILLAE